MDRLDSLLDIIDQGEARYANCFAFGMRGDDGSTEQWTYRELNRRSRIIAWRLRAIGLGMGDRLLIWTPSSPAVPALYFGAMRAGLVLVPLDLRMSPGAIERIVARADARHLVVGTGRDTPDPADARLADEHVVRFIGQHELAGACQRIETGFGQRAELVLSVAVGEAHAPQAGHGRLLDLRGHALRQSDHARDFCGKPSATIALATAHSPPTPVATRNRKATN